MLIDNKSTNGSRDVILKLPGGRDLGGHPILLINIRGCDNNNNNHGASRTNIVDILQYLLSIFRLVVKLMLSD